MLRCVLEPAVAILTLLRQRCL